MPGGCSYAMETGAVGVVVGELKIFVIKHNNGGLPVHTLEILVPKLLAHQTHVGKSRTLDPKVNGLNIDLARGRHGICWYQLRICNDMVKDPSTQLWR
jgi:hypothetical protein